MGRIFEPAQHLSSWRRLAPHVWDRPRDPTVYGVMDLVVDRALPYLDALDSVSGTKVRITYLVT
ncbi:MAG: 2-oxo acid dehydrogenase, partial [Dehalococcoidia bacterium]|nr:2-oxo acid dehydrogenase [Dehalococcoidia bacterium]